jgi:Family of unknown function (DUF5681)
MPFVKGHSGNPAGRPVGSRNKFTSEMHEALEEKGLLVIQRLLVLAAEGNTGAIRQCLDRLMGKHKPSAVQLPSPESPRYLMDALTEIHRALGAGEIASDEAARLVDLVGRTARVLASKAVAVIDFADRLERCEQILRALLNASKPAAAKQATSEPVPDAAPQPAIDHNSAKTMAPPPAEADELTPTAVPEPSIDNNNGITMETAAALDEAIRASLPRRGDRVKGQLLATAA